MNNANQMLQVQLNQLLANRQGLKVLEAGCGSSSHIVIPNQQKLIGIDISQKQLERNKSLDEKILGNLQSFPLQENEYDVIVSWDVLEHLDDPMAALMNLFRATADAGIIVLAAPNFFSIKGLVTKILPHSLHVAFYRYVIGDKRAGKDDQGPFKTYLRKAMWPDSIVKSAKMRGFSVYYIHKYEGPVPTHLRQKHKIVDLAFGLISHLSRLVMGRSRDLTHSDYLLVLQKAKVASTSS